MEGLLLPPLLLLGCNLKSLRNYSDLLDFELLNRGQEKGVQPASVTHMITLWKWGGWRPEDESRRAAERQMLAIS